MEFFNLEFFQWKLIAQLRLVQHLSLNHDVLVERDLIANNGMQLFLI